MAAGNRPIDPSELERDSSVTFADGSTGRVYTHSRLDRPVPSSTTVKDTRIDPEKEEALQGWRDKYDGSTEERSPHHEDQSRYYKRRGTLVHYALANAVDEVEIERGEEEEYAQDDLRGWEYDDEDAYEKCLKDIDWCLSKWDLLRDADSQYYELTGGGKSLHGNFPYNATNSDRVEGPAIDIGTVLGCEQYVLNREWRYAGQYDFAYEQPDGVRVLADFKTSSGIRLDHKLQLALYDCAMDTAVDRWQVIRLDPEHDCVLVEDDRDWDRSKQGLRNQALSLAERCNIHRLPDFTDDDA